ncbi:MAG TPA: hypothetical protein PK605_01460 [Ignavibacteria bacterium]|nr:hypothetical protein [Ignavibacteria bacterium]HRF67349.1 hypothetical protein [Ignavibacteria bacterium]HRJ03047.1 hypothetical protein [Ignavibacteria bacterium]
MKTRIAGLLYFILAGLFTSVYSQESEVSFNKSADFKGNNSLSDLPFQVGMEFGPAIPLKEKKYFYNGWWIFGQVNLYDKRIFLRAAYGNLKTNNEIGNTAPYFSVGFTGVPLVIKQHSISVNTGLSMFTPNDNTAIIAFFVGVNYLYRFNRYVSLSAGIQMPVIRRSHYDEYYHNPFATIGVVFF